MAGMVVNVELTRHEKAVQLLRDYARHMGCLKRPKMRSKYKYQTRLDKVPSKFSKEAIVLADEWLHMMDFVWIRERRINSEGFLRLGAAKILGLRDLRVAFPHLSYEELAEVYPCILK